MQADEASQVVMKPSEGKGDIGLPLATTLHRLPLETNLGTWTVLYGCFSFEKHRKLQLESIDVSILLFHRFFQNWSRRLQENLRTKFSLTLHTVDFQIKMKTIE